MPINKYDRTVHTFWPDRPSSQPNSFLYTPGVSGTGTRSGSAMYVDDLGETVFADGITGTETRPGTALYRE